MVFEEAEEEFPRQRRVCELLLGVDELSDEPGNPPLEEAVSLDRSVSDWPN